MTADVDDPSVYLLDLSRATPNAAISDRLTQDCWTAVDYEIEAGVGRMLFATRTQHRRGHRVGRRASVKNRCVTSRGPVRMMLFAVEPRHSHRPSSGLSQWIPS